MNKKKNILIRFFGAIKSSFATYSKVSPHVKKTDKIKFFFRILFSQFFVSLNPVSYTLKNKLFDNYSFKYTDWFSDNINVWKKYLSNINNFDYLEIGTFEGRSAVFVGQLKNINKITCVDTFQGSDEHKEIDFELVYKNCLKNLNKIEKTTELLKEESENFFLKNNKNFDVIYIDGSHYYDDVKKDYNNSIKSLNKNGILICDDFLWFQYENKKDNPLVAILESFYKYKDELDILFLNYQIIFKKK